MTNRPSTLPLPNIAMSYGDSDHELTPEEFNGMLHNPIYAGCGPFPAITTKETWVAGAKRLIEEEGIEQFLVNMLYVLDLSLKEEHDLQDGD